MSNDYRNSEGYPDPTAGEALSGLLQMKSSPFVLSGLSPTSALRFPEMWRQMWPMPDATAALPWTRDISLSHRIRYFRQFIDDDNPDERELGLFFGNAS